MQIDKPDANKKERKEAKRKFLLAVNTCPVCGSPTRDCVCQCCREELGEFDQVVVNRFIHTLASRQSKRQPKFKGEDECLDITEIKTDM